MTAPKEDVLGRLANRENRHERKNPWSEPGVSHPDHEDEQAENGDLELARILERISKLTSSPILGDHSARAEEFGTAPPGPDVE